MVTSLSSCPCFLTSHISKVRSMTLVDVCIAPILWRLGLLGITLNDKSKAYYQHMQIDLFEKEGFHESLTFAEKDFN